MCQNGQCLNMEGSYKCVCNTGYTLSDDGLACIGGSVTINYILYLRLLYLEYRCSLFNFEYFEKKILLYLKWYFLDLTIAHMSEYFLLSMDSLNVHVRTELALHYIILSCNCGIASCLWLEMPGPDSSHLHTELDSAVMAISQVTKLTCFVQASFQNHLISSDLLYVPYLQI